MKNLLMSTLALLLLPLGAHAALVQQDWLVSGDGEVTLDDQTGLLWLDLPISSPLAVNSVNSYTADGWTPASLAQVQTLISNQFGSSLSDGSRVSVPSAAAHEFVNLFGVTFLPGISEGRFYGSTAGQAGLLIVRFDAKFGESYQIQDNWTTVGAPNNQSGVLYVKAAAVPEPGAVGLVISGLLGVAGFARRRRAA